MKLTKETELKIGAFVSLGVVLLLVAILMLTDIQGIFSPSIAYKTRLSSSEGLMPGAKVVVGGLTVGAVEDIVIVTDTGEVEISFQVDRKHAKWIKTDSVSELQTQGMLGDKYLAVKMGSVTAESLPAGATIPSLSGKSLSDMIPKADQLMMSLNSIAQNLDRIMAQFEAETRGGKIFANLSATTKNLADATGKLNKELEGMQLQKGSEQLTQILEKINRGQGTLGALINDPSLYDEAKNLVGGVNRNRVMRNLVRQTVKDGEASDAQTKD